MDHLFIDSDVILDFLLGREPWNADAARLLELLAEKKATGFTSTFVIANVHYQLRRAAGEAESRRVLKALTGYIAMLGVTDKHIRSSLDSTFNDFEDAVKNAVAESHKKMTHLLTRNTKDYKLSRLAVMSPSQYFKSRR